MVRDVLEPDALRGARPVLRGPRGSNISWLPDPTPEQANYFARAAGTSRFVWNWALAEWDRQYQAGEKPTALKLKKQFNAIRRDQFPWTWDVTKNASDQPILDLGKAFTAFFEGRARRPRFKSKKRSKASFYLANDQFDLGDHRLWYLSSDGLIQRRICASKAR
jgi:transposase